MTYPITGPYSVTNYLNFPPTSVGYIAQKWWEKRDWYRQSKPYNLPLEFAYRMTRTVFVDRTHSYFGNDSNYRVPPLAFLVSRNNDLYARIYKKFKSAVGDSVSGGLAFAEGRKSMDMITKRLMQLVRFTNDVRRGRFGDAAKELGIAFDPRTEGAIKRSSKRYRSSAKQAERPLRFTSKPLVLKRPRKGSKINPNRFRGAPTAFAANYLEFHFGWVPLMMDIHDAAEALSSPIHPHSIKVGGALTWHNTSGSGTTYGNGGTDKFVVTQKDTYFQQIKLRAEVSVTNPNLALAQQMGLINPLTIAWELVPFSFVLDWFVNIGDFLSRMTDFAGLAFANQQRTEFTRWVRDYRKDSTYNINGGDYNAYSYYYVGKYWTVERYQQENIWTYRILGPFPGLPLYIKSPWDLSPRRGLAAVSLLLQKMR